MPALSPDRRRLRTLVVVPTYEEAENIEEVLRRFRAAQPRRRRPRRRRHQPRRHRRPRPHASASELGGVDVVGARRRRTASATPTGTASAIALDRGYDRVVQMDADLSHDPAALPDLLAAVDDGVGLVIGSRYVPGGSIPHWPWHRRALSKWGNRYTRWVLGMRDRRHDVGLPRLAGRHAPATAACSTRARAATCSRSRCAYRVIQPRRPARRGADHLHRPRARAARR